MILDLKHRGAVVALTLALIAGGAHTVQGQHQILLSTIRTTLPPVDPQIQGVIEPHRPLYETRAIHDQNGTGKFYMGREIAQVMGPAGIPWLDRPEREDQEKPSIVLDALKLRGGETVADLGAGSGYFTFRIAPRVGRAGKVLAVEIQDEMLQTIRQRAQAMKVTNVEAVKGSETDPNLPMKGVDLVF